MMSNHKEVGDEFEQDVARALRNAGLHVEAGELVSLKRVDLLATEQRLGQTVRLLVECKGWDKPLDLGETSKLIAQYAKLLPNHADEFLLVTRSGLSDAAAALVRASLGVRHVTLADLRRHVMEFGPYLNSLVEQYDVDPISSYYVDPQTDTGDDLKSVVEDWLQSPDATPLAILGSYGLGKTTFARHLAWDLAKRAQEDSAARIPVLVRLSDIAAEQSLEGLLGKLFTATNVVRNYNFSSLEALNRDGRFVFIFDGFDEMKQLISWPEFKYNFSQINRLVTQNAKVVVLGRPTAFLTDAEHRFTLRAARQLGGLEVRDPDAPIYREITIGHFDRPRIERFLPRFVDHLVNTARSEAERRRFRDFSYELDNLLEGSMSDLARRPVQLKMLIEILPDYRGHMSNMTVHDLYDFFVDVVIERETEKSTRGGLVAKQRRAFARDIAYWLWLRRSHSAGEAAVPPEIVSKHVGPSDDLERITRNLVAASILDRRLGEVFFFPHRSIQEFLVAEAIWDQTKHGVLDFDSLRLTLTPDIAIFLRGFGSEKLPRILASQVDAFQGALPLSFFGLFRGQEVDALFDEGSLWAPFVIALSEPQNRPSSSEIERRLRLILNTTRDPRVAMTAVFAALVTASRWPDAMHKDPSRIVGEALLGLMRLLEVDQKRRFFAQSGMSGAPLWTAVEGLNFGSRGASNVLHVVSLYKHINVLCRATCFIDEWRSSELDYRRANLPEWISDPDGRLREMRGTLLEARNKARELRHAPAKDDYEPPDRHGAGRGGRPRASRRR